MRLRLRIALDTLRRRARTAGYLLVFVAANVAGAAAPAAAADDGGTAGSTVWRWMDVNDSHGHSAWGYSMSLDYGGITDTGNALFGGITGLCWFIYQFLVIVSIWLINFALSLEWFTPLEEPARNIADSLQSILDQVSLPGLLLAATAVGVGFLIVQGTNATAIFEVVVALVILTLGTGVFANPVDKTVGADGGDKVVESAENQGWLAQTSAAGLEVAGSIQQDSRGGSSAVADTDEIRQDISEQLVDTFLRSPHQLINYGKILDGTECGEAYDNSLNIATPPTLPKVFNTGGYADPKLVPDPGDPGWEEWDAFVKWYLDNSFYYTDSKPTRAGIESGDVQIPIYPILFGKGAQPRDIVGKCDKAAGERAENPSPGMAGDSATIIFGVFALLGFAALLAFTLIYLGVQFLWCAVRSIWDFIVGLGPGNLRNPLWQTIAAAIWALIGTFGTSIILVTFLMTITRVAASFEADSIMAGFAVLDLLLFAMLLLFWRLRKRMRDAADRTAEMLSKRPGRKPMKMPARGMTPSQSVATYYGARTALKGGARATKLGASAVKTGAKIGLIGTGVGAVAGGVGALKGGRGAGRAVKRAFDRIGMAGRIPMNNNDRGRDGTRPDGAQDRPALGPGGPQQSHRGKPPNVQQRIADLRGRRKHGGGPPDRSRTQNRRRPPGRTGGPNMRPRPSSKRAELTKRLVHARAGQPWRPSPGPASRRPAGPQPGNVGYRRVISADGQIVHVPVEDDDKDDE